MIRKNPLIAPGGTNAKLHKSKDDSGFVIDNTRSLIAVAA